MKDLMGLMKKAEELQSKMNEMQENLGNVLVEGKAGGGLVTVTLSGKGELKALKIDRSLFKEDDVEVLEDLIIAAHTDAKVKTEAELQKKMAEVTSGIPLPPGIKFPF